MRYMCHLPATIPLLSLELLPIMYVVRGKVMLSFLSICPSGEGQIQIWSKMDYPPLVAQYCLVKLMTVCVVQ